MSKASVAEIDGALAIAALGHIVDVVLALVLEFVGIFFPRIALVFDVACAAQVAGELLLRFGDVDAIVEPEIVLDPGDRGLEDQFLFGARDLLFVKRGDRGLRSTRDEAESEHGIAHLLEHMAFKGTKTRSALQIAEAIEDVGGYINAYTSREVTAFYARVLKDDVSLALDVVADILRQPVFDQREIEVETHADTDAAQALVPGAPITLGVDPVSVTLIHS